MKFIQFVSSEYIVSVKYEDDQDMEEVAKFEAKRIKSLESRFIDIVSEKRVWDPLRKVSLRRF